MPNIASWEGGVNTKLHPQYLKENQSVELINANIESGILKSENGAGQVRDSKKYFYEFINTEGFPFFIESEVYRNYVEYNKRLCFSDGKLPMSTDGTVDTNNNLIWQMIGSNTPEGILDVSILSFDDILTATAILTELTEPPGIQDSIIEYRVVKDDKVYSLRMENSTYSSVEFILPDTTYKVYREGVDTEQVHTGIFHFVGEGSFTDAITLVALDKDLVPISVDKGPHRLGSKYGQRITTHDSIAIGTKIYYLVSGTYSYYPTGYTYTYINEYDTVTDSNRLLPFKITVSGAFTSKDMSVLTSASKIYLNQGTIYVSVYNSNAHYIHKISQDLDSYSRVWTGSSVGPIIYSLKAIYSSQTAMGFITASSFEYNGITYFYSPVDGVMYSFNGSAFGRGTGMKKFPFSKTRGTGLYGTFPHLPSYNFQPILVGDELYGLFFISSSKASMWKLDNSIGDFSSWSEMSNSVEVFNGRGSSSNSHYIDGNNIVTITSSHTLIYNIVSQYLQVIESEFKDNKRLCSLCGYVQSKWLIVVDKKVYIRDEQYYLNDNFIYSFGPGATRYQMFAYNIGITFDNIGVNVLETPTLTGTFKYAAAQYSGGTYSTLTELASVELNPNHEQIKIDVTNVIVTDELRLFRNGLDTVDYHLIEDVDVQDVYIDYKQPTEVAANIIGSWDYSEAPNEKLINLVEHRGRLWGSVDNILYWSTSGSIDGWDKVYSFITLEKPITGLVSTGNGLAIFMDDRSKLLLGTDRTNFTLRLLSGNIGCSSSKSIQVSDIGAFFMTKNRLAFTDGSKISVLSETVLNIENIVVDSSAIIDKTYYLLCTINNKRVILRYSFVLVPVFDFIDADFILYIGLVNNELHGTNSSSLLTLLNGPSRTINYTSGYIHAGEVGMIKEWSKVRVSTNAFGTFKILMEDEILVESDLQGIDLNIVIPKNKNKGKYIQFQFEGTGEIYNIEYTLGARKTTK